MACRWLESLRTDSWPSLATVNSKSFGGNVALLDVAGVVEFVPIRRISRVTMALVGMRIHHHRHLFRIHSVAQFWVESILIYNDNHFIIIMVQYYHVKHQINNRKMTENTRS